MSTLFEQQHLFDIAKAHHEEYVNAEPFPHCAIDNFMPEAALDAVLDAFPSQEQLDFYRYDNPLEKKLAFDQIEQLPDPIQALLTAFSRPTFLRFLEKLTGIDGLIPDPYFRGGGIHQIPSGGKLDIHIDFNRYKKLDLDRRLNVILYLNRDWPEEYGGHFELWEGQNVDGKHELTRCVKRVLPIFNRLVVFSTSERSYHGHPQPLTCPADRSRRSLATYFYTSVNAREQMAKPHSTTFIKRPEEPDDPELERLREERNQARLSSNVKSAIVAE